MTQHEAPAPKIFLSSTVEDLTAYRSIAADQIERIEAVNLRMEKFGARTRPPVAECRRVVAKADLLVVIVAHRYGWVPTKQEGGDGEKSITRLEVDTAEETSIPILAYLVDPKFPWVHGKESDRLNDGEADPNEVARAVGHLRAFKQQLSGRVRARFTSPEDLGQILAADLGKWARERDQAWHRQHTRAAASTPSTATPSPTQITTPAQALAPTEDFNRELDNYRNFLKAQHRYIRLAGFPKNLRVPIKLEDLYVTLHAIPDIRREREGRFADAEDSHKKLGRHDNTAVALVNAFPEAARRNREGLVVLGDPGSGKTTHLRRMVLWMVHNGPESLGLPSNTVPVFLPLRRLHDRISSLSGFIEHQLADSWKQMEPGFPQRLRRRGTLLLLVDGLDEVVDIDRRQEVAGWVQDELGQGDCKLVATCRYAGYTEPARLDAPFLELHLRPLTRNQAEEFVRKWYFIAETGMAEPDGESQAKARTEATTQADDLIERLGQPELRARRVFELTRNPLLLTNLCLVHRDRGSGLPKRRSDLYEDCVEVLLSRWRDAKQLKAPIDAKQGKRVLQPVAYWLHREEERTRATADQLTPILTPALKAVNWKGGDAKRFLARIRDESGLLTGWDQQRYGFMHLGFQEYLTAREIKRLHGEGEPVLAELAQRYGESWWMEVLLLLLSLEEPPFVPLMREVVKQPAFGEKPELLDMVLDDATERSETPFLELLKKRPGRDRRLWQGQFQALRALEQMDSAALAERYPGLAKHPYEPIRRWVAARQAPAETTVITDTTGLEWVAIPAGAFLMGSPESEHGRHADEGPQRPVHLAAFQIGRYPVTNEEYGRFLEQTSDVEPPQYWNDRSFNQARQPVVGVSWDDAKRFAAWVGGRLPSEAEWEYAARAGTTAPYLTGDTEEDLAALAWYGDVDGSTKQVGQKAPNAWGLHDVLGNVWEWVEDDWHDNYGGAPNDGSAWVDRPRDELRVLRGGSFYNDPEYLRVAYRHNYPPGYRYNAVGFRVVRVAGGQT